MKIVIWFLGVLFLLPSCGYQDRQSRNISSENLDSEIALNLKEELELKSGLRLSVPQKDEENKSENLAVNSLECNGIFDLEFYNSFNEIPKKVSSLYFSCDSIYPTKPINYYTDSAFKIDNRSILVLVDVSFQGVCSNLYAFVIDCEANNSSCEYLFSNCDKEEGEYPRENMKYNVKLSEKVILIRTEYEYQNDSIVVEEKEVQFPN